MRPPRAKAKSLVEQWVRLGKHNIRTRAAVLRWCRYARVEQLSPGLIEKATGLPTSYHTVDCAYKVSDVAGSQSLKEAFAAYYEANCERCPKKPAERLRGVGGLHPYTAPPSRSKSSEAR